MAFSSEPDHPVDTFPTEPIPTRFQPRRPTAPPPNLPAVTRLAEWQPGVRWWDARTALVTRRVGQAQWATVPRLVVPVGQGRVAFRVSSRSAEARHLRQDNHIVVQTGDWRGSPALGSRQYHGTAQLVQGGPVFDVVEEGMRVKYGMRVTFARLAHRAALGSAPYGDLAVIITIDENLPFAMG